MAKTTVVVVDDSALVRSILTEIINRQPDMECIGAASDPYAAREMIRNLNPDVITLDVEMPRMDGFEFARNVRADDATRHIPIIMITSRTADKHRNHATEIGVNEYMGKPYQEDQLLALIKRYTAESAIA
jgi:chemosensory pili system protein ChpA (sensor histidine kinase/response regulator)